MQRRNESRIFNFITRLEEDSFEHISQRHFGDVLSETIFQRKIPKTHFARRVDRQNANFIITPWPRFYCYPVGILR